MNTYEPRPAIVGHMATLSDVTRCRILPRGPRSRRVNLGNTTRCVVGCGDSRPEVEWLAFRGQNHDIPGDALENSGHVRSQRQLARQLAALDNRVGIGPKSSKLLISIGKPVSKSLISTIFPEFPVAITRGISLCMALFLPAGLHRHCPGSTGRYTVSFIIFGF